MRAVIYNLVGVAWVWFTFKVRGQCVSFACFCNAIMHANYHARKLSCVQTIMRANTLRLECVCLGFLQSKSLVSVRHIYMCVCMCVCMYVCMYVYIFVCMCCCNVHMDENNQSSRCWHVCMHACMDGWMIFLVLRLSSLVFD